jgi:hypothetical protein
MLRTPAGQPLYVEAPVTVTTTHGTYLIGAPTFVWADSTAFVDQDSRRDVGAVGVKLLNDSTAIPLPPLPSVSKPYMPIAVGRGTGLVAVWGTSGDTSLAGVFAQDTLWEATLDAGRWSAARPIWTSGTFAWYPTSASYVADDASLSVAFPSRARGGINVMTRSRDRWRTRWISVGNERANGVAMLRLSESELLLAVVGSIDRDGIRARNAGYVARIATTDTASEPRFTLLYESPRMSVEDPSVFGTTDALHFVWRLGGRNVPAPDSLMEATSLDGGTSWTLPKTASLEGDMRGLRARSIGGEAALAVALGIRGRSITSLRRSGEGWTVAQETFHDAKTVPMVSTVRNRVTVAFGRTRSSVGPGDPYDAPVLVTSSRASRCESASAASAGKRLRAPPRGKPTLQ